jgi:glycine hydroxymethyltransferase
MPELPADEARLLRLVRAHDRWRGRSVFNLLPSENAVSPRAREFLSSDLAGRYTLPMETVVDGERIDNSYAGTKFTDEIETLGNAACARLFHAKHATLRPLSGHVAAMSALVPLLPKGSKILAIPPDQGGYDGYAPGYLPALFGWEIRPLPADGPGHSVDAETAVAEIRRERPTAVVLGQSFFLFPYPLKEIAEAAHSIGALVFYDASHVLGLIAGGEFQKPLSEGADVVFGSTHKSFPGPQGGIVATDRSDLFAQIDPALVWRVFDNAHWNRIAGVAQTVLELERCGAEYARTVVQNSQALAHALVDLQVPVLAEAMGYTRSHQLLLDRPELKHRHGVGPGVLARRWERQRLITDLIGRLGTAEVTRLGLLPTDMSRVAELLVRAGLRKEKVAAEVLAWRKQYPTLRFA